MILLLPSKYLSTVKKFLNKFEIKHYKKNTLDPSELSKKITIGELMCLKVCLSQILKSSIKNYPQYGDLILDNNKNILKISKKIIPLRNKEFNLLKFFIKNPKCILSRKLLLKEVWNYSCGRISTNTLEVHLAGLRKKIAKSKARIITFTGIGYMLQ